MLSVVALTGTCITAPTLAFRDTSAALRAEDLYNQSSFDRRQLMDLLRQSARGISITVLFILVEAKLTLGQRILKMLGSCGDLHVPSTIQQI